MLNRSNLCRLLRALALAVPALLAGCVSSGAASATAHNNLANCLERAGEPWREVEIRAGEETVVESSCRMRRPRR